MSSDEGAAQAGAEADSSCTICGNPRHCQCWHDDANWRGHGLSARYLCSCGDGPAIVYPLRARANGQR
jgi:hypothetical protein